MSGEIVGNGSAIYFYLFIDVCTLCCEVVFSCWKNAGEIGLRVYAFFYVDFYDDHVDMYPDSVFEHFLIVLL